MPVAACLQTPWSKNGTLTGAVLIIMDVTGQERREALRREFAANVSPRAENPLTSILGTAEILRDGLVRPEDVTHFAGNIHREAQRLIDLVNDIIRLSRLDEGGAVGQWESISLRQVAQSVMGSCVRQRNKRSRHGAGGDCGPVRGVPDCRRDHL